MTATAQAVLDEVNAGTSNIRTLFRRLKKVHKDAALWDAISELRSAGKLTYDACSGALATK